MSEAFFDYVRGRTECMPAGHDPRGMRAYRHLVWLGAGQAVEGQYPDLRTQLGEDAWRTLIAEFVRQSAWTSHNYGELHHEFTTFLARMGE